MTNFYDVTYVFKPLMHGMNNVIHNFHFLTSSSAKGQH